jgi:hypothetical protein
MNKGAALPVSILSPDENDCSASNPSRVSFKEN